MSRKNNLKKRKDAVAFQKKRESLLAKKREEKRKKRETNEKMVDSEMKSKAEDVDMDPTDPLDDDVKNGLENIKNKKMRRRMENELRRLALKGVKVKSMPGKTKKAKTSKEEDQEQMDE